MRRPFVVAAGIALFALGACRAFVDLDGLGGGASAPADDAGIETGTPIEGGGVVDSGEDVVVDAAVDVDSDADAAPVCPSNGGPTPVRVMAPNNKSFCIDSSEVSNEQYAAFLATIPATAGQPQFCAWNTSFIPPTAWPYAGADAKKPVVHVDWCDAAAFCKWAGKRLCGAVGGGVLTPATFNSANASEYVFACTAGGTRLYPYGDTYDVQKCNGPGSNVIEDVKARATCQGGFPGIYDLSGNVHEWFDGCVLTATSESDACAVSDSARGHSEEDMKCTSVTTIERQTISDEVSFRCCSD